MAIATNKTTAATWPSLDRYGLRHFFEQIVGADQVGRAKPAADLADRILEASAVSAARALVVGDSTADIEMARNAGIQSCAVTYGNQSAAHLATVNPEFMIDTLPDLLRVI
jgi:phosphoglycolate phosphatase